MTEWDMVPDENQGQGTPKALRELHEQDRKTIAELRKEVDELKKVNQTRTVKDMFVAKGATTEVAEMAADAGVAATPEAVDAWWTRYGSLFGKTDETATTETATDETQQQVVETVVPPGQQNAMKIFGEAGTGTNVSQLDKNNIGEAIARAQSPEELDNILRNARS